MRRVIGIDVTRTALEGFGKTLRPSDEVVVEATGNSLAVSRVLTGFVSRVIVANPLQVKMITLFAIIVATDIADPVCHNHRRYFDLMLGNFKHIRDGKCRQSSHYVRRGRRPLL